MLTSRQSTALAEGGSREAEVCILRDPLAVRSREARIHVDVRIAPYSSGVNSLLRIAKGGGGKAQMNRSEPRWEGGTESAKGHESSSLVTKRIGGGKGTLPALAVKPKGRAIFDRGSLAQTGRTPARVQNEAENALSWLQPEGKLSATAVPEMGQSNDSLKGLRSPECPIACRYSAFILSDHAEQSIGVQGGSAWGVLLASSLRLALGWLIIRAVRAPMGVTRVGGHGGLPALGRVGVSETGRSSSKLSASTARVISALPSFASHDGGCSAACVYVGPSRSVIRALL
ncbi:hypothetical protein R1flu_011963 [Riccia fluitans]|uniref:Uncharacterized protein n=1 Tax=Riccia fluitans TaxID=41844 RepID=A0ABD1Z996_9MARC